MEFYPGEFSGGVAGVRRYLSSHAAATARPGSLRRLDGLAAAFDVDSDFDGALYVRVLSDIYRPGRGRPIDPGGYNDQGDLHSVVGSHDRPICRAVYYGLDLREPITRTSDY